MIFLPAVSKRSVFNAAMEFYIKHEHCSLKEEKLPFTLGGLNLSKRPKIIVFCTVQKYVILLIS
jgi:hypothetical protein